MFYLLTGVLALAYTGEPFWTVFVILGCLALILSVALGVTRTRYGIASRSIAPHMP